MSEARARLLVVDDDPGVLRLMEKTLRREGFEVMSADSGAGAQERLESSRADLLLLDLKLRDMGGLELIGRLAGAGRSLPFVVITGQGDERVAVEMMKRGALDYLVKDAVFQEALPAVVMRALAQVEGERRLTQAESALVASEQRFRLLVETAGVVILVLDRDGTILEWNREAERVFGATRGEVLRRNYLELFLGPSEREAVRAELEKVWSGRPTRDYENGVVVRDGSRPVLLWNASLLSDPEGRPLGVIAVGQDITERRRLERELLEVSRREQRRIGQDLHDGLGQQLTAIEFLCQVLEQRLEARAADEAERAADIARHVRNAIAYTRNLARGLSPVELEAGGLMASLEALAGQVSDMFDVRCEFVCRRPVAVEDNGLATHLYRIAQEAVTNAIRHGRAKRISVELAERRDALELVIRDDGVGFRVEGGGRRGMGVQIMGHRAGMVGGTVAIRREEGGGTTVECLVPWFGGRRPEAGKGRTT